MNPHNRIADSAKINNPHDALFKAMCTDIAITVDLLKHTLPATLFKSDGDSRQRN